MLRCEKRGRCCRKSLEGGPHLCVKITTAVVERTVVMVIADMATEAGVDEVEAATEEEAEEAIEEEAGVEAVIEGVAEVADGDVLDWCMRFEKKCFQAWRRGLV